MAVRTSTYGRQMDRNKKGQSLEGQMKRASFVAGTKTSTDTYQKPGLADRTILALLKFKKKDLTKSKKSLTTERTSDITNQLRNAGLSQEQINKLRGKKK